MSEILTTESIKQFFTNANGSQLRCLMSVLDKMQDAHDKDKHTPIPLTVAILAQAIYQSEIMAQRKCVDKHQLN